MGAWKAEYDLFHWQGNCETTELAIKVAIEMGIRTA